MSNCLRSSGGRKSTVKKCWIKNYFAASKSTANFRAINESSLSAEDVYKALLDTGEDVGLATVYRVLTQFEAAGLVSRHNFEGGYSVFELSQKEHHDHLVCIKCGLVEEFVDEVIELRQREIAEKAHFKMTDHALNIYGLCPKCQ